ncbi:hypothetical protein AMS68_007590 [Peltaster fructicola]|uniref:Hydrophobin n=1 Tax=Peltaster fructicola TaxID=286661 RepID=A0A6H0Y4Z4_9PEZI|nr:hypothetical protein AMS68_007590 [Peltaster fructicola]
MQFTTILSILAGASMVMANPVANYGGGSGGGSSTTTTTTNNGQQCGNGNKAYCCGQDALGAILPITCILDIQNCAAVWRTQITDRK